MKQATKTLQLDSRLYLEPDKIKVPTFVMLVCALQTAEIWVRIYQDSKFNAFPGARTGAYLLGGKDHQLASCHFPRAWWGRSSFAQIDLQHSCSLVHFPFTFCSLLVHFFDSFIFISLILHSFSLFLHLFPFVSIQFLDPDHAPDSTWQIWGRQDVWHGLRATNWNVPSKHQTGQAGHA